ncbi:MAG: Xanthine dehydrogenase iron-sulfur subunit [Burkholderiaceae bacterium]|jgi:carbon-monoxide dehydrogenase small subunit|nr:MAG: Xanthine dehydrogenase iron-sulfur subunit [Burkholderiaceae bacterium]
MKRQIVSFTVNGEAREIAVAPNRSLLDALRTEAGLTGTKKGCDVGECGSCTIILDGKPVNSCLVLAVEAEGADITTVEGLQAGDGSLHRLQECFIECGAAQCGFCTPGLLVAAKALLDENPSPTIDEIRFAIAGNICRCTGYTKILDAILLAAQPAATARAQGVTP